MSRNLVKPAGSTWTDEQWLAITERGSHLLVAAAAGSGKTAVLVERIIRTVSDEAHPVDIDQLLVATFTNAAAAEMRHRLRAALEKALAENPASRHLRRQLALVGRASITTLHSFCLDVVRRYVHMTSLDPSFRIANETEAALLRQEALEAVLEERYGSSPEHSVFWQLAERFGGDRGDEALMKLIERLYDFSRSHPFPNLWLRRSAEAFRLDGEETLPDGHPWLRALENSTAWELEAIRATLLTALSLAKEPGGPNAYVDNLTADAEGVYQLIAALRTGGWRALQEAVLSGADQQAFGRLKSQRGDVDQEIAEKVKKLRKEAKDKLETLKKQLLIRSIEEYVQECRELAPLMEELVRLVEEFAEAYKQAKTAKGLVDFSDLEHACLTILRDASSGEEQLVPSAPALAYREQFVEVYVDEYQDTNAVQEAILQLVSRGDGGEAGNRFMVGDVKQSIYRFRLAEPGLFLHKYKTYQPVRALSEESSPTGGKRIDLARNFRSRREVVDAVNFIFRQTMHEEAAELDYDEQAELICGASYPEPEGVHPLAPEVLLIDRAQSTKEAAAEDAVGAEEESLELDAAELEARTIAERIAVLMGRTGMPPMQVYDKSLGGLRPLAFRDIVILLRADKAWAPSFIEQLKSYGIPAYAELGGGYFDAVEIRTMLALLQTIDNPLQDIPLAAVLRSPMFGFSGEDLARVRIAGGKHRSFYEALGAVASGKTQAESALYEKAKRFVASLEPWRTAARQGTLADLILRLYRETGYYDFVGGLPGGMQRQANLRALYDRARQYEATSFRGLFRFLRFIERLRDSGADLAPAPALGETEDVVRIMSVHKSKGLEFPVVFVAGLGKSFNRGDEREPFLIHKELGFGPRFVDTELGIAYPTLPQLAIRRRLRSEALAEEMRVLYVALTRAKEKLILVGSAKDLARKAEEWNAQAASSEGVKLPAHVIHKGNSFLDWMMPALLRHPAADSIRDIYRLQPIPSHLRIDDGTEWQIAAQPAEVLQQAAASRERTEPWGLQAVKEALPVPDGWTARDRDVMRILGWHDARSAAASLYAKTSVTEWKRRLQEEEEEPVWLGAPSAAPRTAAKPKPFGTPAKRPRFMEQKGLSPVERGVAYHAVMQHLPLGGPLAEEELERLLEDLVFREIVTEEQQAAIDRRSVLRFLESEPGLRLAKADKVYRELPFSVGLPAAEVYGTDFEGRPLDEDTAREIVLVQGVIDCLFEEDGEWVLLDYKTDQLYEGRLEVLVEQYRLQLAVYAKAVETSLGKKVKEKYLYFFSGEQAVKL